MIKRLFFILVLFAATTLHAGIIFEQDWEDGGTGSATEGFRPVQYCSGCTHAITNSTARASEGNRSLRLYIKTGDPSVDDHTNRANMGVVPGATINGKKVLPWNTDRWIGFSIYIESDPDWNQTYHFSTHAQNWGSEACSDNSVSSAIVMRLLGPRFPYISAYNGADYVWKFTTSVPEANNGNVTLAWSDATDDVDGWTHFVIRLRWVYGSGGIIQIWKNGNQIFSDTDFNISTFPIPQSCGEFYPKIAAGNSNSRFYEIKTYFDNIRWGDENSSFAEVDPTQDSYSVCDSTHLWNCDTESTCTNASGYWCDSACQSVPCASTTAPTIQSVSCSVNSTTYDCDDLPYSIGIADEVTISATTDLACTMKRSYHGNEATTPDSISWSDMTYTFTTTGGTSHSFVDTGYSQSSDFYFPMRCSDGTNDSDQYNLRMTVASDPGDTTGPPATITSPSSAVPHTVTTANVQATTPEASDCYISDATIPSTPVGGGADLMDATGGLQHNHTVIGLGCANFNRYVRCWDGAGNPGDVETILIQPECLGKVTGGSISGGSM